MSMLGKLTVICLEQRAQLDALEPEWNQLLSVSDIASPFLTPGWQHAWLDTYGRGRELFVLTARRGARLVGLWPLSFARRGVFRILEPIGAGRSDWLDVLSTSEDRQEILASFIRWLADQRSRWDLLDWRDVLDDSPSIPLIETISKDSGIQFRRNERTAAPYLLLPESWEHFLKSKRAKFRTNLNYYRRLAERSGKLFSISRHSGPTDRATVKELAEVELRSWKAREGNLKVSTRNGSEFYDKFCSYFSRHDQLDLWRAECDQVLVAFLVNIRFGGKCYHYNTCFDEAFAHISPGLLLHADAIKEAFSLNLREYDFLSGDEPYKERWSTHKRRIHHLAIFSNRMQSRAAFSLLVGARWAFRRSEWLRAVRAQLLAISRKVLRNGGS